MKRCPWPESEGKDLIKYHDEEWGVPLHDDLIHFEYLILDTFQAGLSWSLMIKKRENFRKAFDGFNPKKIAKYTEKKKERLMNDAGIIRNRAKINAAVSNAKVFLDIQKEFGTYDKYVWQFVNGKTIVNKWKTSGHIPIVSPEAEDLSKDMKERGFKFVGPITIYAYMQGAGLVNDHIVECFRYKEVQKL